MSIEKKPGFLDLIKAYIDENPNLVYNEPYSDLEVDYQNGTSWTFFVRIHGDKEQVKIDLESLLVWLWIKKQ